MSRDDLEFLKGDEKIIAEAKKRFKRCESWESTARERFLEDIRFCNGDADNRYQWDSTLYEYRIGRRRPCLTINKTRQHCLQVINDAKQNKPGVNIRPVGNGATYESAQVFEDVVRHIEYISGAEQVYDTATTFQVQGGIGYWRVVTDYVDADSDEQEIYLRRVKDPLSIYLDPDLSEVDGSDARFGFAFERKSREEFIAEYPQHKDDLPVNSFGDTGVSLDSWMGENHVIVCEYYRKVRVKDRLILINHNDGSQQIIRESLLKGQAELRDIRERLLAHPDTKILRSIEEDRIEWYLIGGNKILDRRLDLPDRYIPIVRVVGEETVIDGVMDRKGHTRALKDPQRMYNYWASEATAQVALQTVIPFTGPLAAYEGLEAYYTRANTDDVAYLPYNHIDESGNPIPAPTRQTPPVMASAFVQGMQITQQEMMMASGQYQAQMGENENAKSGKAISERQRQGDNATYHFIDGLAIAIRFTGKILIDLIPKIYDTKRVLRMVGEDGVESDIQIDPEAEQAYLVKQGQTSDEVKAIFNPNVGRYSVEADVGPGYATRRQEAFNAITQVLGQAPNLVSIIGDLLFKAADFPMADEIAERLGRMVPPQAKGDGPTPQMAQMQEQIQSMQGTMGHLMQALAEEKLKTQREKSDRAIAGYDAETKRITAIGNSGPAITPDEIRPVFMQLMAEMMQSGLIPSGAGQAATPQPEMAQ